MTPDAPAGVCPRCGAGVRHRDDGWWCDAHGSVPPLTGIAEPSVLHLLTHLTETEMPCWLPWPLPGAWAISGLARAVGEQTQATVVALTGPDVIDGNGDLLVVCEEPGVGLGARFAGLDSPDPGRQITGRPASLKVMTGGRATPLWWLTDQTDRDVFVGEASGRWLWIVAWPATTGALVRDGLHLADLHDHVSQLNLLPLTELSERLSLR